MVVGPFDIVPSIVSRETTVVEVKSWAWDHVPAPYSYRRAVVVVVVPFSFEQNVLETTVIDLPIVVRMACHAVLVLHHPRSGTVNSIVLFVVSTTTMMILLMQCDEMLVKRNESTSINWTNIKGFLSPTSFGWYWYCWWRKEKGVVWT